LFVAVPAIEGERLQVQGIHNCRMYINFEWQISVSQLDTYDTQTGFMFRVIASGHHVLAFPTSTTTMVCCYSVVLRAWI
jgi:hypothetical protein